MNMPSTEWGFCNPTGTCSVLMLGLWNRANQCLAGSWPSVIPELELLEGWALSLQHLPITAEAMLPLHVNTENRCAAHSPSAGNQCHSERCPLINALQNKSSVSDPCMEPGTPAWAAHGRKGSFSFWPWMVKLVPSSPVCNWVLDALVKAHQGHSWADPSVSQESGQPGAVSNEPCSAWGLVLTPGTGQSQGEALGTQVVTAWGWTAEDRWFVISCLFAWPCWLQWSAFALPGKSEQAHLENL